MIAAHSQVHPPVSSYSRKVLYCKLSRVRLLQFNLSSVDPG